jgi:hypothetical protein
MAILSIAVIATVVNTAAMAAPPPGKPPAVPPGEGVSNCATTQQASSAQFCKPPRP